MELELEEPIHTIPTFGPAHVCSPECWCHPTWENWAEVLSGDHTAKLYVHNVAH
jgi:hypothetical protein